MTWAVRTTCYVIILLTSAIFVQVKACTKESWCTGSKHCCEKSNVCKYSCVGEPCAKSSNCAGNESCCNEKCSSSLCPSVCSFDHHCPSRLRCCAGKCVASCGGNQCFRRQSCASNEVCCNGKCTSHCPCRSDGDCGSGGRCCNKKCIIGKNCTAELCFSDSECGVGESCCGEDLDKKCKNQKICLVSMRSASHKNGLIVGLVVFLSVSVLLCIFVKYCRRFKARGGPTSRRRRSRGRQSDHVENATFSTENQSEREQPLPVPNPYSHHLPPYPDLPPPLYTGRSSSPHQPPVPHEPPPPPQPPSPHEPSSPHSAGRISVPPYGSQPSTSVSSSPPPHFMFTDM